MALIYALLCSWSVVLRKLAARKHNRLKSIYETAKLAFLNLEQECKLDEVAIGRPANYQAQVRLLKLFEASETARTRWLGAQRKLSNRKRFERRLRKLNGKKLPYTFGLLDMALVFKLLDAGREFGNFDLAAIWQAVSAWFV